MDYDCWITYAHTPTICLVDRERLFLNACFELPVFLHIRTSWLSRYRTYRTLYFVRASFAYEGGLLLLLVSLVCSLVSLCSEQFETS